MVTMRTRNTVVGLCAGLMSTGAGVAIAACDLAPPISIIEEGQSVQIQATCAEALATVDLQVTDAANNAYDTGPLDLGAAAKANQTYLFHLPSDVVGNAGQYTVDIKGTVLDSTALVSAATPALVIVMTNPNATTVTVTDPVVTDPVVTDPVVTDPVVTDSSCPTPPSNVKVVNTSLPTAAYPTTSFSPEPETITAFKFSTPGGTALVGGSATATVKTAAGNGKTVRITHCPGDTEPVSFRCSSSAAEVASVRYFANYNSTSYCVLEADTTYYMQVINKYDPTSTTYSCGGSLSCGFYFNAD